MTCPRDCNCPSRNGLRTHIPKRLRRAVPTRASRDTTTARIVRQRRTQRQRDADRALANTRAIVAGRAGGFCEMCGARLPEKGWPLSHRRHDGMGGAGPDNQRPSNLLASCVTVPGRPGCNDWLETAEGQAFGLRVGWLVRRSADPALVPVQGYRGEWRELWLDDHGGVRPA